MSTLEKALKEMELMRQLHGSQSKQYGTAKDKVGALKRDKSKKSQANQNQYAKRCAAEGKPPPTPYKQSKNRQLIQSTKPVIHNDFDKNKKAYKELEVAPVIFREVSCRLVGGVALQALHLIPTIDDAEALIPNFTPKSKVVEGAILRYIPTLNKDLPIEEKDKIINVIGRGFARGDGDEDPDFSYVDAKVAHRLLYHVKDTIAIVIKYSYDDPETNTPMIDIAGAILLSQDLMFHKHHGNGKKTQVYSPKLNVCNMVQLTVLPEYNQRGLGAMSMQALEAIMLSYKIDLVFWVGCVQPFYDMCGSTKDPKMIKCPFNLAADEANNRAMFYYLELKYDGKSKFQKNVVDFYKQDPNNRYFTIEYKNDTLKSYYNLLNNKENDGAVSANNVSTAPHDTSFINEVPGYNIDEQGDEVTISIDIQKYHTNNLKFDIVEGGEYLIISGARKDDNNNMYKFEMNFKMDPIITEETIDGDYAADSSMVIITAKSKIINAGYS